MVRVLVRVFAGLRERVGWRERQFDIKSETVRGLLQGLKECDAELYSAIADEEGRLMPIFKLLLNGRDIDFLAREDTKLNNHDILSIFPPVAGG